MEVEVYLCTFGVGMAHTVSLLAAIMVKTCASAQDGAQDGAAGEDAQVCCTEWVVASRCWVHVCVSVVEAHGDDMVKMAEEDQVL